MPNWRHPSLGTFELRQPLERSVRIDRGNGDYTILLSRIIPGHCYDPAPRDDSFLLDWDDRGEPGTPERERFVRRLAGLPLPEECSHPRAGRFCSDCGVKM